MTAAAITHQSKASSIRQINLRQDLAEVADLIEQSFANTLDADGRRYVSQMRQAARNPLSLGTAGTVTNSLTGFVWEEDGRIVGNLSMIPVNAMRQRAYLIANVAVDPAYRRRGIAAQLTQTALEDIRRRDVRAVWLQVNQENPGALALYQQAGFSERVRRTMWHSSIGQEPELYLPKNLRIGKRQNKDWDQQRLWLRESYPIEVSWHIPLNYTLLRPGLSGSFSRMVNEKEVRQWSARLDDELIGTLAWQASSLQADWLWMAVHPGHPSEAIQVLLSYARKKLHPSRPLAVNYPAGEHAAAFQAAKFHPHNTLIWMHRQLD